MPQEICLISIVAPLLLVASSEGVAALHRFHRSFIWPLSEVILSALRRTPRARIGSRVCLAAHFGVTTWDASQYRLTAPPRVRRVGEVTPLTGTCSGPSLADYSPGGTRYIAWHWQGSMGH